MTLSQAITLLDGLATRVPPSAGRVVLELEGPLARLRIEHASARNALTVGMMRQLAGAVERLEASQAVVLLISSAEGGAFCAGGHLLEVQQALGTPANGHQMALAMGVVLDTLADLPVVSIAALEGPAIGGGAELSLAADYRVLGAGAAIHFVHTRLGVVPGWGGAGRLVDRLGRHAALDVLLDAASLDAETCLDLGLADQVTVVGGALEAARGRAERILRRGAAARAAKASVVARSSRSVEQRALEASAFGSVWGGEAHREALAKVLRRIK